MPSIPGMLQTTAARCPDREALVFAGRTRTYREFADDVEQAAAVLRDRGVQPGDRVLILGRNSDAYVIGVYAVLRAGAILVPANPLSARPELAYLLEDSGARVLLYDPQLAELARNGAALLPDASLQLIALSPTGGDDDDDLATLAKGPALRVVEDWPAESDDAILMYTSGTTGRPKGALFDHHRIIWTGVSCISAFGLRDGSRILHVAPMYHAAELCIMVFPGTALASTHVILPAFDPVLVADALAEHRITAFFGVPTMYQFLLRVPGLADRDLSAWRMAAYGAAPMPGAVVEQLLRTLPSVELFSLCGLTEAGPGGVYSGPSDVVARPDASGRQALPNTESRIVDADGHDIGRGQVGELLLRGESIMKGYWNKPEATADALADGWLHTGDVALLDEEGYITLVDRIKDMIITGGRNVYSVEVENAIMSHPDVLDVAVLGTPHPDYGESILAVLVLKDGCTLTLDDLRAWTGELVSSYKSPHAVLFHTIPRNLAGKIQKKLLRQELGLTQ